MSTDELRTAAIEAAAKAWCQVFVGEKPGDFPTIAEIITAIVDAILPLLVAGTASRIADAIEAERWGLLATNDFCALDRNSVLDEDAAIARRVGESNG